MTADTDAIKIALAHLLRGPLHAEDQPQAWSTITTATAHLRDHLAPIGLRLLVDEVEGYAYLRADDQLPEGMPRLVRRHSLTFGATVLLILLRRHLTTAEADSPRVVITAAEMATWLGDYYPDGVSPDKLDGDINQVVKLGYLRRLRGSSDDYEIRRIIKAVVTADWINAYGDQVIAHARGPRRTHRGRARMTTVHHTGPTAPMTGGARLEQFQMLNWGTFDGAVHRLNLHSGNTLLTGQVGSGKSTIVDGLTALFAPTNKVTFNRAAGAERSERTVATYVRGTHRHVLDETTGTTRAESLRPGKGTYTVLLASFTGGTGAPSVSNLVGDDGTLTAGIVFWFTDNDTNPSRFHILAPTRLDIGDHLLNHASVRALKAALRSVGATTFDVFRDYQKSLCRCLNLTGGALDLLVQTISMKQVGNLTDFVRNHLLDTPDVKARIARVLEHYGDLLRPHELVQVAKAQLAHLDELAGYAAAYDRAEARIQAARTAAHAVPARGCCR